MINWRRLALGLMSMAVAGFLAGCPSNPASDTPASATASPVSGRSSSPTPAAPTPNTTPTSTTEAKPLAPPKPTGGVFTPGRPLEVGDAVLVEERGIGRMDRGKILAVEGDRVKVQVAGETKSVYSHRVERYDDSAKLETGDPVWAVKRKTSEGKDIWERGTVEKVGEDEQIIVRWVNESDGTTSVPATDIVQFPVTEVAVPGGGVFDSQLKPGSAVAVYKYGQYNLATLVETRGDTLVVDLGKKTETASSNVEKLVPYDWEKGHQALGTAFGTTFTPVEVQRAVKGGFEVKGARKPGEFQYTHYLPATHLMPVPSEEKSLALEVAEAREKVKAEPENPKHLNTLAWNLALSGEYEEAVPLAQKSLEIDDQPYVRDTLAYALVGLGKYEEAVAEYDKVLAEQEMAGSYFGRAKAYEEMGQKEKAEMDYAKAREIEESIDLKWR